MKKIKGEGIARGTIDTSLSVAGSGTAKNSYAAEVTIEEIAYASASGSASGAHRILDLISCGVADPAKAAARARKLLLTALWQLEAAERQRAKREASKA